MLSPGLTTNDSVACGSGCCSTGNSPTSVTRTDESTVLQLMRDPEDVKIEGRHGSTPCANANPVCSSSTEPVASIMTRSHGSDPCCGPDTVHPTKASGDDESPRLQDIGPVGQQSTEDGIISDCCSMESTQVQIERSRVDDCLDGCCSVTRESTTNSRHGEGDHRSGKEPTEVWERDGKRSYSSSAEPSDLSASGCCEGKSKPCCSVECIDRLVVRECITGCTKDDAKAQARDRVSRPSTKEAETTGCCPRGITARRFYRGLLERLGCLCVTIRAAGGATCCSVASRTSPALTEANRSICAEKREDRRHPSVGIIRHRSHHNATLGDSVGDHNDDFDLDNRCAVNIRGKDELGRGPDLVAQSRSDFTTSHLEAGVAESQHIILSVSGMTCVGCETKLQRALVSVEAVHNVKTSLILCRAEFDLDRRFQSVGGIIHHLQRTTEFTFEELEQGRFNFEVLVPDVETFIQQNPPVGVLALTATGKMTVRVTYDSHTVGARDLLERHFASSPSLAPAKPDPNLAASSKHVRHVGLMTLVSAALTIPVLVFAWAPLGSGKAVMYGAVSLALATLVQFVVAGPFYPAALKSLIFARIIEMDLLIVISSSAAYIYSVVAFGYRVTGNPLSTGEFFETSTLLVTLIMVGRWTSALARQKAVESVSLRSMQTSRATLIEHGKGTERVIDARLLQYGDIFRVAPESRIVTDGVIIAGTSEVDESMVTGESLPVAKRLGDAVLAGSVNCSGVLTVRLSRLPGNNTVSAIADMVDEAKLSKPRAQAIADKVAKYFVPTVIALAIIVFVVWIIVGIKVRQYDGARAVTEALTYAITVIIVSCPCAIGLAVPLVIVIAGGVAARNGCIFKTAATIEAARETSHVVFDKTGTLTQGRLAVAVETYLGNQSFDAAAVHALVSDIRHPVSVAIKAYLEGKITEKQTACDITSQVGRGVEGTVRGKLIKVGNSSWLGLDSHPAVRSCLSQGLTTLCVTVDGHFVAVFGLRDSLRSDARQTIAELQRRGIKVSVVSGDDEGPVSVIAQQVNVADFRFKCTPADKFDFVKSLTDAGHVTIFCGDGTNDAVALTQATIGVHMNGGTDVAQCAADVVLIRSSLIDILTLIDLSKAAMRRIACNFGWSIVYNTLSILFASGALVNVRIPPAYAGLGELISVLPVIAIAVQLRWARFSKVY